MCLYIKDAAGTYAYMRFLIGSVVNNPDIPLGGSEAYLEWNGLGNQGSYKNQPLPPGNYTITLYISKSGYTAYETNPLTIFGVDNVQWEEYFGNDTINDNKIFPGKYSSSDDNTDRNKIRVVATLTEELSKIPVYYKYFDVDDPSSSDPGGSANTSGPDNYAIGKNQGEGFLNGGVNGSGVTNGSGIARTTFKVSMQPGDNFRIAATLDEDLLNTPYLTQAMADSGSPPSGVVFSPILTVWRKLWIEQDSMSAVATTGSEKNLVSGTGATYSAFNTPSSGQTTVYLGIDLPESFEEEDHFKDGTYVAGGVSYPVISSEDRWTPSDNDIIVVDGNATGAGGTFVLYDDDWDRTTSNFHIDFNLPEIKKINLNDYPLQKGALNRVYILAENLPGTYEDTISFVRNSLGVPDLSPDIEGSADFWKVQVIHSFQFLKDEDNDPGSESGTGGLNIGPLFSENEDRCAVFHETTRDVEGLYSSIVMLHEIIHAQDIDECGNPCLMKSCTIYFLCDECAHKIRNGEEW